MTTLLSATEAAFQNLVIEYAQLTKWRCAHFRPAQSQSGNWMTPMQGDAGFPDLVMARSGRVVLAELKSESGRLTEPQEEWLLALGWLGFQDQWVQPTRVKSREVYVFRPSDFPEVKEVLR